MSKLGAIVEVPNIRGPKLTLRHNADKPFDVCVVIDNRCTSQRAVQRRGHFCLSPVEIFVELTATIFVELTRTTLRGRRDFWDHR